MEQASFIRKSGLEFLGDLSWNTHLCQFYHRQEDFVEAVTPFLETGLKNNEYCLWILPEGLSDAVQILSAEVKGLKGFLKKGQIEIVSSSKWYLSEISTARLVDQWKGKIRKALENGFDGMRAVGGVHKIESDLWKPFLDYERTIHEKIAEFRMIALCTYSLPHCPLRNISKVIGRHHKTFLKKGWQWEVVNGDNVV